MDAQGADERDASPAERLRATVAAAIEEARAAGLDWPEVAERLGLTEDEVRRVAGAPAGGPAPAPGDPGGAHDGEGRADGTHGDEPHDGERVVRLGPVTAFTEMDRLARAGRHGWRIVGAGTAVYLMAHTDTQWEFRRVFAGRGEARLIAEGWQRVGTGRFPWGYYQRPTGETPEPEDRVGGFVLEP